jgi:outer membrane protein TolC
MMDEWKYGFQFSASMTLSPATISNIKQTKIEYEARLLNYAQARQELEYNVRRLYKQLLLLQSNVQLLEQNAASAEARYGQPLVRQRSGHASNLDELSARLDAQTRRIDFQNAQSSYDNALDSFKQLLMIPLEEKVSLQGSLLNYTLTDYDRQSAAHNESMQTAVIRKSIDVLEAQKSSAQARSYSPSLTLSWGTNPMYSGIAEKWSDSNQFSIALSMKLDNLFPWSQAKEQINAIDDAIAKQQNILQESAINRENNLQKLRRSVMQSLSTLENLQLNIALAEETYASYETAYRLGAADLQSVNNARDNLLAAQNRLLSEQYNLALLTLDVEKEFNVPFGSILQWN